MLRINTFLILSHNYTIYNIEIDFCNITSFIDCFLIVCWHW